jgi:choline-sulfatase
MLPAMRWNPLVLLSLPTWLIAACGGDPGPASQPQVSPSTEPARPNFVIIDIDSMRADSLPAPDAPDNPTPALQRLVRQSVRFEHATSPSSWTFPALAGLLTGRYPPSFASMNPREQQLAELGTTLPEILRLYGYHNAVAWGETAPVTYPAFGRGFDRTLHGPRPGADPAPLEAFLRDPPEPFFLLVHDMDLHRPVPPPQEKLQLPSGEDRALPCQSLNDTWKRGQQDDQVGPLLAMRAVGTCYRGALEAYDDQLGALLAALERDDLDERTVVILTSNHGEELFEHPAPVQGEPRSDFTLQLGHAELQYETVLRVPLLIRDPLVDAPHAIEQPVELLDLAPTILARADIPPPHDLVGQSLLPLMGLAEGSYEGREVYTFANPRFATLRRGPHKLIHRQQPGEPLRQLFDLERDPGELDDLSAQQPALAAELGARLDAFIHERMAQGQATPKAPAGATLERELKERGYWEMVREEDR